MQTTNTVLMIRPSRFSFNLDTAANNRFQTCSLPQDQAQAHALVEFDGYVAALREQGVEVLVAQDSASPHTPDSIFPNNWWSSHADGTLVLYPMQGQNRRREREKGVLEGLLQDYSIEQVLDFTELEQQELFLEGTGSMVLDRVQRICYAGYSARTHIDALRKFVENLGYRLCAFSAVDREGVAIYHTNVMMSVGTRLAVVCLEALSDLRERAELEAQLRSSGKEILALTWEQLESFAGNMLEVHNRKGEPILVMSRTAWFSLDTEQRQRIERHAKPLPVNIDTIELIGGGSARCMLAEVHLPKQTRQAAVDRGVGRTGELFAYQHYGVEPDILTSAKSLGGGFPMGAMLTREGLARHLVPGTHGTTYGGNPLGCAVAEAVFDLVSDQALLDGVKQRAEQFTSRLAQMAEQYGVFNEIRGLGLLIGCVLSDGWRGRAKEILNVAAGQGLILLQAGPDVLRFAPSLIVSEADRVEGLARFERTLVLLTRAAD